MSSAQGFRKATWAWRDPLKTIQGKRCAVCGQPATCAVLSLKVGPACKTHGMQAEKFGYDVVFSDAGTLTGKKV